MSNEIGNDDLLIGIPKTLEEAIETLEEFYSKDLDTIRDMDEDVFVASIHFNDAMFIRSSWFLWYNLGENKNWPKSKPGIVSYFNDLGIYHGDDISSIIILSFHRHLNKKPMKIEEQVQRFKDFWLDEGYEGGIFTNKKIA